MPAVTVRSSSSAGGNSAGQAALFLGATCARVYIAIRGPSLEASMSRYLIDQIDRLPHIAGPAPYPGDRLDREEPARKRGARRQRPQETSTLAVRGLFVFIGAQPATGWLDGQLAKDDHGFLLTGSEIPASELDADDRTPLFLETSRPGIFCVGDVRSGSVKRCATAIGEGSMAVRLVFERLQATGSAAADPPRALS